MGRLWYPHHAAAAACLSACWWWLPEVDYWSIWYERSMRSNCLPHIPGI